MVIWPSSHVPMISSSTQTLAVPWGGQAKKTQRGPSSSSTQLAPKAAQSPFPQSAPMIFEHSQPGS